MKKFIILIASLASLTSLADSPAPKIKIKEIKQYVKTINPDSTCMDEYIIRRKQLIIKLSLAPVRVAAGTVASAYTGAMMAAGVANSTGVDGWAGLGYVVGGGMLGGAIGATATAVDATVTGITLKNNVLITKAVYEQQTNREGLYTDRLYKKYLKKSKVDLPKEDFLQKLIAADAEGKLCDGTMVKQPRIKLGSRLKYKVAKLKDLIKFIDNTSQK